MFTYADDRVCVACRATLTPGRPDCPSCGVVLSGALAGRLFGVLAQADVLAGQLRTATAPAQRPAPLPFPTPTPLPPVPPAPERTGVRTASVPAILLGTGALCLLVAAVIFLAVAWSWLGVGGRTAVLVTLTGLGLAAGPWLRRRGLTVAAESLVTVALGLVTLDVLGAVDAGWLGDPDGAAVVSLVGLALAAGAAGALVAERRLVAPQLAAVLGAVLLAGGLREVTSAPLATGLAAVVGLAALAVLAWRLALPVAAVAAAAAASCWWVLTAGTGAVELAADLRPTLASVWVDGPGWALACCAALLAAVALLPRIDRSGADLALAAAGSLLTGLVVLPVVDEGATAVGLASLVTTLVWLAALAPLARTRPIVAAVPAALSVVPATVLLVGLLGEAAARTLAAGPDLRLADTAPVAHPALVLATLALLLVVAGALLRDRRVVPEAGLVLGLGAVATVALAPVPLWIVVAGLWTTGAGYAACARLTPAAAAPARFLAGLAVVGAALLASHPSSGLVLAGTLLLLVVAAAGQVAGREPGVRLAGAVLVPLAAAGAVWAGGAVLDVDPALLGVPAVLVVAALAVPRARPETEGPALLAALVSVAAAVPAAVDVPFSLALHLTLLGALLSLTAVVHPHRRPVGWAGSAVLTAALWVRLLDAGVVAPEAYTLPPALALVVTALYRLWRDPGSATTLLAPGLVLATTPSLLRLLTTDPVSLRAVLLGAACLALVLLGTALRWSAPLLVGAGVGAALTLLELAPYVARTPQWVLIGLAGTVLTLVGITWERRVVELRRAVGYVGRLR